MNEEYIPLPELLTEYLRIKFELREAKEAILKSNGFEKKGKVDWRKFDKYEWEAMKLWHETKTQRYQRGGLVAVMEEPVKVKGKKYQVGRQRIAIHSLK
jgi:hypothetical protein